MALSALLEAGLFATDLGQLFLALVGLGAAILVGRAVLYVVWRLVTLSVVVVGCALLLSTVGLI
ncbi:hypothetical protein ACNS7O_17410 (plasmid) [Haloferacaceae archaeon DSL9]